MEYYVHLWEDEIERDEIGKVIHHPLNSRYFIEYGKDTVSYGYLSFAGHDLDKSDNLSDVKVFYLEFQGESKATDNRDAWADPIRERVLNCLINNQNCWYLSMIDIWFNNDKIENKIKRIVGKQLNQINIKSEKPYGDTYGYQQRIFFEVPNNHLSKIINYFWTDAAQGYPIEGYNMKGGQIDLLKKWDSKQRDDILFREVIDNTYINFYTFPAENRFFVFVTNKVNYAELADLIKLEELQELAKNMGTDKN